MYVLLCQLLAAFTANSQQPVRFSEPRRSLSEGLCTLILNSSCDLNIGTGLFYSVWNFSFISKSKQSVSVIQSAFMTTPNEKNFLDVSNVWLAAWRARGK